MRRQELAAVPNPVALGPGQAIRDALVLVATSLTGGLNRARETAISE